MGGLGTLLLFAVLFYVMMRFGCGAHMVHGHGASHGGGEGGDHTGHGGSGGTAHQGSTGRDPVCGMDVAPGRGYTMTHEGREYRLCSRSCLDKFEANPGQYAKAGGAQ